MILKRYNVLMPVPKINYALRGTLIFLKVKSFLFFEKKLASLHFKKISNKSNTHPLCNVEEIQL